MVKDRETWHAAVAGVTETNTTEQLNIKMVFNYVTDINGYAHFEFLNITLWQGN